MNERIKELVKQCWVRVPYYPAGNDGHPEYNTVFSQEKFAELIVRECANQATWHQDTKAKDIGGELLKYFGVEE